MVKINGKMDSGFGSVYSTMYVLCCLDIRFSIGCPKEIETKQIMHYDVSALQGGGPPRGGGHKAEDGNLY